MKKLLPIFASLILFFNSTTSVFALNDPASVTNNKFGIHVTSENDLGDAQNLVNTDGGDWGYVTFVITEAERDHDRWQRVFDDMRKDHLIPIIRLATKPNGDSWDAPQEAEINNWIAFLNNLNWVIQNRYVVINNEPNHAQEWGGRVDPAGYATYLKEFSGKLKSASPDFFVLPAGLDPSSANTSTSMTEDKFIKLMKDGTPDVFNYVDGWTSHAYPSTSTSIYNHELALVDKKLPVFVTETGWSLDKFTPDDIAKNIENAYKNTWNDPKVVAVTPFILNYTNKPYDVFSWKKADGSFYKYYSLVQSMPKIKGQPIQIESGQILAAFAQPVMFSGMDFVGAILTKNTGQTIWDKDSIGIGNEGSDFKLNSFSLNSIEPTKLGLIFFRAAAAQNKDIYTNSLFLTGTRGQKITNSFTIEGAFVTVTKDQIMPLIQKILTPLGLSAFLPQ